MEYSIWVWAGFLALVLALLAFDLGVLHKKDREIGVREALLLSLGYFVIAMIFNAGIFHYLGAEKGYQFLTGYLIEKSLSVDNIFVFVLVFTHFAVPPQYQHRVLFWGVLGALVMRAIMIFAGTALIAKFHWLMYVFGGFLIVTAIKMLVAADEKPDFENNKLVAMIKKRFAVTDGYRGHDFFAVENGRRMITPLFIVLVLIELTDLIFAVDSIPAIFAITSDPFIVYTSNVFAILGLRALYFALAGIVHRFEYLKYGLSLVLIVIGTKMLLNAWFGEKVIPTEIALLITAVLIGGSMVLSLVKTRGTLPPRDAQAMAKFATGWVPGTPALKDGAGNSATPTSTSAAQEDVRGS